MLACSVPRPFADALSRLSLLGRTRPHSAGGGAFRQCPRPNDVTSSPSIAPCFWCDETRRAPGLSLSSRAWDRPLFPASPVCSQCRAAAGVCARGQDTPRAPGGPPAAPLRPGPRSGCAASLTPPSAPSLLVCPGRHAGTEPSGGEDAHASTKNTVLGAPEVFVCG